MSGGNSAAKPKPGSTEADADQVEPSAKAVNDLQLLMMSSDSESKRRLDFADDYLDLNSSNSIDHSSCNSSGKEPTKKRKRQAISDPLPVEPPAKRRKKES
jgi:hypothetical protein